MNTDIVLRSVERIAEYIDLDQEGDSENADNEPPSHWPSSGSIEMIDYSTSYSISSPLVLHDLNLRIQPGQKVGIVGRTGAGKSSLALALLRGLEAQSGKIVIDDIDISKISLTALREAISIVPQDPALFSGSLRSNLDPMNNHSDEEVFEILEQIGLNIGRHDGNVSPPSPTSPSPRKLFADLSSQVAESGSNMSQGQRQLVCLARALLRRSNIILLDEATSSVDYQTEDMIRSAIAKIDSTVITVAHRLRTIYDHDVVVVLDTGRIVEVGNPKELVNGGQGLFWKMCQESGDAELAGI